jgi:hypothetical protein
MSDNKQCTYFGITDFRNRRTKFGIKNIDRSRHVYVIGKTGMGKSTLLENMAAQDILNGEGMCFVDPHGSAIDTLLEYVPEHRINDVVYFAPFDTNYPISFNVMEDVDPDSRHLVVNGLMASFKKIWQDAWSARMEYILTNTLLALLEYPDSTLLGVNRMLAEKDYRKEVIKHITDSSVKSFWIDEYGKWDERYAREAGAAIQNKIGQFTANPLIRNIIGQTKSSFDIRKIMDNQQIFLVNLSKGRIGEQNAKLLGGMIITKIYLAAMSRAEVGGSRLESLPNFYFFVDEFQNFATESFADILSEARKYKLNLTIAHQYVAQMQEEVRDAVVGNVGTMITFRIGAEDAELFEKQFSPVFTAEDIVNLGKFQIYLSLMIDGIGSKPFSAKTMPPIEKPSVSRIREVIEASRKQFAKERSEVEKSIATWYEPIKKPERRTIAKDNKKQASKKNTKESPKEFIVSKNNTTKKIEEIEPEQENVPTEAHISSKLDKLINNSFKVQAKENNKQEAHRNTDQNKNKKKDHKKNKVRKDYRSNQEVKKSESKKSREAGQTAKSSLQEALAKAMKQKPQQTTNKQVDTDTSKKFAETKRLDKQPQKHSQNEKQTKRQQEIPEDVLHDILS